MMTHEQLQQIRTIIYDAYCEGDTEAEAMLVVIDAALAAPEPRPFCYHDGVSVVDPEFANDCDVFPLYTHPMPVPAPEPKPVGCKHFRYSVDVHGEQIGNCLDCGAEGRMRFVVDGTAPPNHYDQTALELCEVCGWKTLIPGDCCLNCERGKIEQEPVAWRDKSALPGYPAYEYNRQGIGEPLYIAPVPAPQPVSMETVYDTIIEWSTAGKGSRRELARRMIALFATPQREWQDLTKDEINDCAGAEIYSSSWAMAFARAIESKLKEKNHG